VKSINEIRNSDFICGDANIQMSDLFFLQVLFEGFEGSDWQMSWNGTTRILLEDLEAVDWQMSWDGTTRIFLENFEAADW
jgi:hypothetical protein